MENKKNICKCVYKELYGSEYQNLSNPAKDIVVTMDEKHILNNGSDKASASTYLMKRKFILEAASYFKEEDETKQKRIEENTRREKECNIITKVKQLRNHIAPITAKDIALSKVLTEKTKS